jgi:hypothetical protein
LLVNGVDEFAADVIIELRLHVARVFDIVARGDNDPREDDEREQDEEVLQEGSTGQKQEAERLLDSIR